MYSSSGTVCSIWHLKARCLIWASQFGILYCKQEAWSQPRLGAPADLSESNTWTCQCTQLVDDSSPSFVWVGFLLAWQAKVVVTAWQNPEPVKEQSQRCAARSGQQFRLESTQVGVIMSQECRKRHTRSNPYLSYLWHQSDRHFRGKYKILPLLKDYLTCLADFFPLTPSLAGLVCTKKKRKIIIWTPS